MDISYKFENIKFNFRTSAIIENGTRDKVLVQQSVNDPNFRIMGGRVSLLETSLDAIQREVQEELGYDIPKEKFKLVLTAEDFFDYKDENDQVQTVHGLEYIYKVVLDKDHELNFKDGFHDLEKQKVTFYWKSKEELEHLSVVPSIVKELIQDNNDTYRHEYIDDRMFV